MVKSRNFLYAKKFVGLPKESDFELVEEELPELKNGEIRTEALCWSVDPYMRPYPEAYGFPLGSVMMGGQIARVIETKSSDYKNGDLLYGHFGWRTHTNVSMDDSMDGFIPSYKLPDFKGLPLSLGLGALGMPGATAYFGLLEICEPKAGETVVVSGAAGAVGSLVGQIAKIKGCQVIGIAGSDEKCKWLVNDLNFDRAINYKTQNVFTELKAVAKNGIDCYFDNVGGVLSSTVISQMNPRGRISVCGSISSYNEGLHDVQAPILQPAMVFKELKMEGFIVRRWKDRWSEAFKEIAHWIAQGKMKTPEWTVEGFENMPKAFIGMLKGENTGKAIIKAKI